MCRANRCRSAPAPKTTNGMPPRGCQPEPGCGRDLSKPCVSGAFLRVSTWAEATGHAHHAKRQSWQNTDWRCSGTSRIWSWTLTRSTFTALSHAGPLCVFRRERSCRRAAVRFGVAWPGDFTGCKTSEPGIVAQSGFAPDALTTLAHLAVSLCMSDIRASGVPGFGSRPSVASFSLTSGSASTRATSWLMRN